METESWRLVDYVYFALKAVHGQGLMSGNNLRLKLRSGLEVD